MIALTSLFHANSNKTNNIQNDHQQLVDFFEVDGCEKEGEGWWASMLGFLWKNPWDHFFGFFGAGEAIGAMLLHPQVIK